MVPPDIRAGIACIAEDALSGATALVQQAVDLLRAAAAAGDRQLLREVAAALCRAQPSMAGFRTAAALATSSADPAQSLAELSGRIRRGPAAIAHLAAPLIQLRPYTTRKLTVVTCSRSESVERTLERVAGREPVLVCCAESRPAREGAALAHALAEQDIEVELYSDAGISGALAVADALVVGADAVSGTAFINKVGTAGLCALARTLGISVYVLAGSEKILPDAIFQTLPLRSGPPDEPGEERYRVRNPLFERTPAELVTLIVTDRASISPEDVEEASLWLNISLLNSYYMLDIN
ncbi:MAG: hypothetical protein ACRD15_19670 [Vicinamibacterales bacterium]